MSCMFVSLANAATFKGHANDFQVKIGPCNDSRDRIEISFMNHVLYSDPIGYCMIEKNVTDEIRNRHFQADISGDEIWYDTAKPLIEGFIVLDKNTKVPEFVEIKEALEDLKQRVSALEKRK